MLTFEANDLQCKVCGAHATGFHFNAQSCSACCAFFRRAISLNRVFKCPNGYSSSSIELCPIIYTEQKLCRACRLWKCLKIGMNKSFQGPKGISKKVRAYCTKSGLQRNKRFSVISSTNLVWKQEYNKITKINDNNRHLNLNKKTNNDDNLVINKNKKLINKIIEQNGNNIILSNINNHPYFSTTLSNNNNNSNNGKELLSKTPNSTIINLSNIGSNNSIDISSPSTFIPISRNAFRQNILTILIEEEMRIAERRRILFCERQLGSLLGSSKPFTIHDIKPLQFREFRKSIRIHILLIYEWLRVCPYYSQLCGQDQLTTLRKCVLYHTILDPCFITLQIGDLTKFVMPNGGYVSTISECSDGWEDEKEISRDNKKKIYWPLLNRVMSKIIAQMVNLQLGFEEFVALKALVSIQMTISDTSQSGKIIMKQASDEVCQALSEHYNISNDLEKATRFGNILLLLSPIFDTATNFVESHHQVQFFDLWQLDSLLLQFLKNRV